MAREYFETQKERQMKLKKINAVLGLLIVLSLCGHAGTMGFSLWTGWYSFLLCKSLAKITISLLVLHVFCSLCLFFFVHDGAGLKYSKCNVSTILQRISALLILGLLHIHMRAYAHMATKTVLGTGQTAFFCVTEIMFFASVLTHVAVSVSKGFITLGLTTSVKAISVIDMISYIICALTMIAVSGGMLSFFIGGLLR